MFQGEKQSHIIGEHKEEERPHGEEYKWYRWNRLHSKDHGDDSPKLPECIFSLKPMNKSKVVRLHMKNGKENEIEKLNVY